MENQTEKTQAGPLCSGDLFGLRIRTYRNARSGYYAVIYGNDPRSGGVIADDSYEGFPTRESAKEAALLRIKPNNRDDQRRGE